MEELYTYKQIIEMFGICKQTLNNWRKTGVIKYKKITKKTFMYALPENKNKNIQENEPSKSL